MRGLLVGRSEVFVRKKHRRVPPSRSSLLPTPPESLSGLVLSTIITRKLLGAPPSPEMQSTAQQRVQGSTALRKLLPTRCRRRCLDCQGCAAKLDQLRR